MSFGDGGEGSEIADKAGKCISPLCASCMNNRPAHGLRIPLLADIPWPVELG
jgi:hypothetical protein